jgi:hypothetical protein
MLTDEQLTAMWRRLQSRTPGKWESVVTDHHSWLYDIKCKPKLAYKDMYSICETVGENDADFIANAPADIEALLVEVKRLRQIVENTPAQFRALVDEIARESSDLPHVIEDQLDSKEDT